MALYIISEKYLHQTVPLPLVNLLCRNTLQWRNISNILRTNQNFRILLQRKTN